MNYAETFEEFSSRLGTMDLLLYAGAGLIVYVLFKDKLDPIKSKLLKLFDRVSSKTTASSAGLVNILPTNKVNNDDLFFELVSSWKKTRDLAAQNKCLEAVKVADQMFPYLSPSGCSKDGEVI
jgi:hypothetical protein